MGSGTSSHTETEPLRATLSPWAVMGAVAVLVLMSGGFTLGAIRQLQRHSTTLLAEKGAALIRSFEAGARTGMKGMMGMQRGGRFRMQHLLMETARQDDIVYLMVTDPAGEILAHSDPQKIGRRYDPSLDWPAAAASARVIWRIQARAADPPVFEVYRRYAPTRLPHPGPRHPFGGRGPDPERGFREPMPPENSFSEAPGRGVIFVGLDMASALAARRIGIRQALLSGALILLVGLGAVGVLFLAQANRAARASLSQVQAFSNHVLENLPVGLLALDAQDRVVACNRVALGLTALESGEVLGRSAPVLFPGPLKRVLAQASPLRQEVQTAGPRGEAATLEVHMSHLPSTANGPQGRLLLLQDLTQVRRLQKEVQKQERLAAVGRLAAGVAHEIRNPLSSIKGFALYFKERYATVARDQETAQIMIQEVDRLNRVIGQLLELARPETLEISALAPAPLVRDSLRMVAQQARRQKIQVELTSEGDLPFIAVDPDKIKQVLLNLLLNALESMAGGGRLTVSVAAVEDGKRVAITIQDSGQGIDPEQLGRIYDPYYTTKPGGTGLGLAIVIKILEAHDAPLEVVSEPRSGTRVSLRLPAVPADQPAPEEQA